MCVCVGRSTSLSVALESIYYNDALMTNCMHLLFLFLQDAYLRNPNDWAVNRNEEERTGKKFNYWTLRKKNVVLVVVWSSIVSFCGYRAAVALATGESFYAFGPFTGTQ